MARRTLIDFFEDLSGIDGEFLVYDDGYRTWSYTYARDRRPARGVRRAAATPPASARASTSSSGARTGPSGSSRCGAACSKASSLVPIDYRASAGLFLQRVAEIVEARAILVGDAVRGARRRTRPVWPICSALGERHDARTATVAGDRDITADDVAEMIFTSGATAEPKGVVLTHRNILANIVPIEREIAKYKQVREAVPADPVPEPAAAQPHVRPGDGDVRAADARRASWSSPGASRPRTSSGRFATRRVSVLVCVPKMLEVLRDHVLQRVPEAAVAPPAARTGCARWWRYRRAAPRCSASSSGRWSSAPRRSIRSSKRSGAGSASSSSRATA